MKLQCGFIVYNTHYVQLKTASILHVNGQSLVLADYGVKTGYCQLDAERKFLGMLTEVIAQVCRGELFACFSFSADCDSKAFFLANFFCVVIFQNIKICPNCAFYSVRIRFWAK
jgi:hypothetical protein